MLRLQTVSLGFSEFCGVFTEDEWKGFEYFIGTANLNYQTSAVLNSIWPSQISASGMVMAPETLLQVLKGLDMCKS